MVQIDTQNDLDKPLSYVHTVDGYTVTRLAGNRLQIHREDGGTVSAADIDRLVKWYWQHVGTPETVSEGGHE